MEEEKIISLTTFRSAGEYFAFETIRIRHILENVTPTQVPLTKDYVLGIINNHGNMIPVVDFRKITGAKDYEENTEESSIIVVACEDNSGEQLVSFKVDEVDDVLNCNIDDISKEVVYEVEPSVQKSLTGTIKIGDKFIYTVDIDTIAKVIEQ
ncbi:MAG: chemotaxis protein CheW [Bacteroidales bacterium]|jgi:purine-binding chemotaxis protein CheW|nr:chemotaxis protein CheW [Bacteroidales bacterium]